jgi:hypothetical protein
MFTGETVDETDARLEYSSWKSLKTLCTQNTSVWSFRFQVRSFSRKEFQHTMWTFYGCQNNRHHFWQSAVILVCLVCDLFAYWPTNYATSLNMCNKSWHKWPMYLFPKWPKYIFLGSSQMTSLWIPKPHSCPHFLKLQTSMEFESDTAFALFGFWRLISPYQVSGMLN